MTSQAQALLNHRALDARRGASAAVRRSRAPIVAITGGKGGVGKSTIAANLAISFRRLPGGHFARRVLVADLDLGLASLDAILGLMRGRTSGDFLDGKSAFEDLIIQGPGAIEVLPGPRGIERFAALEAGRRLHLLDCIFKAAETRDLVVLDLPAGIHPDGLETARAADLLLVTATPEPASLADAYAVVKLASQHSPATRIGLVVNAAAGPVEARQIAERFIAVVHRFVGRTVESFGWVPRDPAVLRAIAARRPVALSEASSPAAAALRMLAARVEGACDEIRRAWTEELSSFEA